MRVLTVCGYMESKRHSNPCSLMNSHEFVRLNRSPGPSADWSTDPASDDELTVTERRELRRFKLAEWKLKAKQRYASEREADSWTGGWMWVSDGSRFGCVRRPRE